MKLLNYINEQRKGHYCHALELTDAYDLECVIESLIMELGEQFSLQDYLGFFNSIEVYYIANEMLTSEHNDAIEYELYDADIGEIVRDVYNGM